MAFSSIMPQRLWTSMSVIPPAWVALVAMVWKNRGPKPLWMAYGGVLTSRLVWLPGPTSRFASGDGSGPTSFPNVRVPLIVTFPLGPHTVALYLRKRCVQFPGSPGIINGTLVFVKLAPVPHDPSQYEAASFISNQIPEKLTPLCDQLRKASVQYSTAFSENQSGKT